MRRSANAVLLMAIVAIAGACPKAEQPPPGPPPSVATPEASPASPAPPDATPVPAEPSARPLSASREAEEACVDRWLAERGLDRYGHPAGTMYAGGTPLFDERTGERAERLPYVYRRQPLAREACRPTAVK